jgi:hypothetical protein
MGIKVTVMKTNVLMSMPKVVIMTMERRYNDRKGRDCRGKGSGIAWVLVRVG